MPRVFKVTLAWQEFREQLVIQAKRVHKEKLALLVILELKASRVRLVVKGILVILDNKVRLV